MSDDQKYDFSAFDDSQDEYDFSDFDECRFFRNAWV